MDFKTDHVASGAEAEQAEKYRTQLETYSSALETVLGRKVRRKVLWFLMNGTGVDL